jgi:uncharacterized membrane protein
MSELVVAGFKGEFTADAVLLDLLKMKQEHLIDLDYAVVAARRDDGTITIKNSNVLVHVDATTGCQWGIIVGGLAGLIIGGIIGAAIGETVKILRQVGIKEDLIKEVSETLEPASSAIFLRVRKSLSDKVVEELIKFDAKLLRSSLTIKNEAELIKELGKHKILKETFHQ